ncbi:MAG TPA: hypothetical protein V6D17_06720 [Candidatus Obscuribacterales bacterium]
MSRMKRALVVAALLQSSSSQICCAQAILNKTPDELLKGFDVQPSLLKSSGTKDSEKNKKDGAEKGRLAPPAGGGSLFNQSRDELLKGFDVDQNMLERYKHKNSFEGIVNKIVQMAKQSMQNDKTGIDDGNLRVEAPFLSLAVRGKQKRREAPQPLDAHEVRAFALELPFVKIVIDSSTESPLPEDSRPAPGTAPDGNPGKRN